MSVLQGLKVLQVGPGLGAAVCGRLFADVGADVNCFKPGRTHRSPNISTMGNSLTALPESMDIVVLDGGPAALAENGWEVVAMEAALSGRGHCGSLALWSDRSRCDAGDDLTYSAPAPCALPHRARTISRKRRYAQSASNPHLSVGSPRPVPGCMRFSWDALHLSTSRSRKRWRHYR